MSELKACPFCGGKAVLTQRKGGWTVDCEYSNPIDAALNDDYYCPFTTGELFTSKTMAMKIWNTRPLEDALTARIAELEAKIARLVEAGDELKVSVFTTASSGRFYCLACNKIIGLPTDHKPDCPVTLWNKEAHE